MSNKPFFDIILAATKKGGIGLNNQMPWHLKNELRYFKRITNKTEDPNKKNILIMGKNTWLARPKPLPGRISLVISNSMKSKEVEQFGEEVQVVNNLENAMAYFQDQKDNAKRTEKAFLIGGAKMFEEAIFHEQCRLFYLTRIGMEKECSTFLPKGYMKHFQHIETSETHSENGINYTFAKYLSQNFKGQFVQTQKEFPIQHQEFQYLELIEDLIKTGNVKGDRTGVGIQGKFGNIMRYDLEKSFPLLTTKRVYWRGVVEELLWFLRADTNGNNLKDKKVNIWDGNGSREFLDNLGLKDREVNDLGPIYGFQWRHFGAKYGNMHQNYEGQGVDQIKQLIESLKNNPNSRRHIVSAWNPVDIPEMALPPCHVMSQFYVNNNKLSCILYQRSCDMGLGIPFNIGSYALLTCMIAQVCGLERGEFVHMLGDYHVYSDHIEPLKEQIKRVPRPFPLLKINPDVKEIDQFKFEDFEVLGYDPYPSIKMKMAV